MAYSIAASHSRGKVAVDKIFGASAAANAAKANFGKANVVDATIGVLLDENENMAFLPTVEKVFRSLSMPETCPYSPIEGLPAYLDAVVSEAFGASRPDAYVSAIATSGGTGAIHHTIYNYSEFGDTVLTADWYWAPYRVFADALLRKLDTFSLFDEKQKFNIKAFETKVNELLGKQNSLVILLNTPAHNPSGYCLDDEEWDRVLAVLKAGARNEDKIITLCIDVAYLCYSGEKNECRAFMSKFANLPRNIMVVICYSMSKGYTMYGQRTGAMIAISSDKNVITEFENINKYLSRATWSNVNRGAQQLLAAIYRDKALQSEMERERARYYNMVRDRAATFTAEARAANLNILPYVAGFFLSVPTRNPEAVCNKLHEKNIFTVALAKGVRVALCATPTAKIKGMPAQIAKAIATIGG